MLGACGCSIKGQDKVDRMLSYINSKYTDDTFEYVSVTGGHPGSNVTKIIVKSANYPGKEIRVICSEVDGKEVFTDTYLNIKFEEQTYEYIRDALVNAYGENLYLKYIPDDTACIENGSSNTTFKEYISDPNVCIYFSAAVVGDVDDEDAALATIKQIFSESIISAHIYFVNTDDALTYNALTIIENKTYSKKLYITKETVDEYSKIEWTDGV